MQIDATPRVIHIFLHPFADVACVVVHREVQLFVAAVGFPELVEQLDEKLAVPAPPAHPMEAPRIEVESPAYPYLAVPGVGRSFCSPLRIQQKPTLGLVSSLVSS